MVQNRKLWNILLKEIAVSAISTKCTSASSNLHFKFPKKLENYFINTLYFTFFIKWLFKQNHFQRIIKKKLYLATFFYFEPLHRNFRSLLLERVPPWSHTYQPRCRCSLVIKRWRCPFPPHNLLRWVRVGSFLNYHCGLFE